ncbi:MAG: hypothetical protein IKY09_07650 [Methanocorpusculum sp.]|nr:hypothetical protein [Methanocorpusculum sp.]MBR5450186.1 hypothetical protein [Methanocorpusculum sp.]
MIEQSKYLPKQMNGPVINSVMAGLEQRLEDSETIKDYLYNLSIQTAQETELENIGKIIGYPRPLVPEGFDQENVFLFTTLPMEQDTLAGFSEVDSEIGGRLTSVQSSVTNYMSIGLYRKFLDKVAYIKRYGITIYSVDQIAKLIDNDYTISWDASESIELNFNNPIGFKNLWILQNLFSRFATIPQVYVYAQEEE